MDLRQIIHDHYQQVYRYAYRFTGSAADAEDLVQQTFMMAHMYQHQLRDADRVGAWLFGILRGCIGKYYRRKRPTPVVSLDLDLNGVPDTFPDEPFDQEGLQQALNELSPDHRLVLVMFYFEDLSYQQIAEQLQVPLGTVMSRLARAKTHLRNRLVAGPSPPTTKSTVSASRPESNEAAAAARPEYVSRPH